MSSTVYLVVMLGIIGLLVAVIVPALFWKKCESCGARNIVDATSCARCGAPFPDDA